MALMITRIVHFVILSGAPLTLAFARALVFLRIIFDPGGWRHRLAQLSNQARRHGRFLCRWLAFAPTFSRFAGGSGSHRWHHGRWISEDSRRLVQTDKAELEAGNAIRHRAPGEKAVICASRTRSDTYNGLAPHTASLQLLAQYSTQAEVRLAWPAGPDVLAARYVSKALSQPGINFEAASPDGGAQGGVDRVRPRSQPAHRDYAFARDAGKGAAPTRVYSGTDASLRVDHEEWHAVGGKYSQGDSRYRRNHAIAISRRAFSTFNGPHRGAMHLAQTGDATRGEFRIEAPPIAIDRRWLVAHPARQVEASIRPAAVAAGPAQKDRAHPRPIPGGTAR